jgi:hypothetical protein
MIDSRWGGGKGGDHTFAAEQGKPSSYRARPGHSVDPLPNFLLTVKSDWRTRVRFEHRGHVRQSVAATSKGESEWL